MLGSVLQVPGRKDLVVATMMVGGGSEWYSDETECVGVRARW